ncbi:MAG: CIA30 family protein, partial [SAR324 cluster bacterium]|nr:CIA30 family protein [SAR324 cluster bacterium]
MKKAKEKFWGNSCVSRLLVLLIILLLVPTIAVQPAEMIKFLLDFEDVKKSGRWMVVNDGVMGGVSQSKIFLHSDGYLLFTGLVSTKY